MYSEFDDMNGTHYSEAFAAWKKHIIPSKASYLKSLSSCCLNKAFLVDLGPRVLCYLNFISCR